MRCWSVFYVVGLVSSLWWPRLLSPQECLFITGLGFACFIVKPVRLLSAFAFSMVWLSTFAGVTLAWHTPISLEPANHTITIEVKSLITHHRQYYLDAKLIAIEGKRLAIQPNIRLGWFQPKIPLKQGERHQVLAKLLPVWGMANPAGFDYQKYMYSRHIGYQVKVVKHLSKLGNSPSFRYALYQKVVQAAGQTPSRGVLIALIFGDRSGISPENRERIRQWGLSHLLAISGLHIGLIATLGFMISRKCLLLLGLILERPIPSQKLAIAIGLVCALGYAYLAGFTIPTQRALLMVLLGSYFFYSRRFTKPLDVVLSALCLLLLVDPLAVLSLSFWLSFSAVFIIFWFCWRFRHRPAWLMGWRGKLASFIGLQLLILTMMLPLQGLLFGGVSLLAPLTNLLAIPVFTLVVIPLSLVSVLMASLSESLLQWTLLINGALISGLFTVFSYLPLSWYSIPANWLWSLLLGVILIWLALHPFHGRLTMALLIIPVIFFLFKPVQWPAGSWTIHVFDVGQGLAVLVSSRQDHLLYDTGARFVSGFTPAGSEILPYLRSLGINKLKYLVISHLDNDHAGGADIVIKQLTPEAVIASGFVSPGQLECRTGQVYLLGGLTVDVLSPAVKTRNRNHDSCVIRVSDGAYHLLLTGDIDKRKEKTLVLSQLDKLDTDILLSPHHGSNTSSSLQFIQATSPSLVIHSAGFLNRWKFPHADVISRYKDQRINQKITGYTGMIKLSVTKGNVRFESYRQQLSPYWYHSLLLPFYPEALE